MINWQETLLFPIRDAASRKQFLLACLVAMAGFIVPLLPTFLLTGYCVKIMRQIIHDRAAPAMPDWQQSDWSQMFMDGLRLFCTRLILILPLLLLMCGSMIFILLGSAGIPALAENKHTTALVPFSIVFMMAGMGAMMIFSLLSFPYGIIITAALPHSVAKDSFSAAFAFKEWFPIFRKGLGQFILGYCLIIAASFIFSVVLQFALATLILICIVPLLMIPYMAYFALVSNAMYAQAYVSGLDAPSTENHATA